VTQCLVEEAVFEAVEMVDRLRQQRISQAEFGEPPPSELSPHEALGRSHAMAMAQTGGKA
jgi:hypothetical protein